MFLHLISSITTTSNTSYEVINVMSITVEVSCQRKGEIFYSEGMNVLDKIINQSSLGFSNIQLIASHTGETIYLSIHFVPTLSVFGSTPD